MNYTPAFQDTHDCPGGCGLPVVRNTFACRTCWHRLDEDRRTLIITSRWANDLRAHSAALAEAIQWYRADAQAREAHHLQEMG